MIISGQSVQHVRTLQNVSAFRDDITFLKGTCIALAMFVAAALACKQVINAELSGDIISLSARLVVVVKASNFVISFLLAGAAIQMLLRWRFQTSEELIQAEFAAVRDRLPAIPVMFLAAVASFGLFIYAFCMIKVRIPYMHAFSLDPFLEGLDSSLFGGQQPWRYFKWVYDLPYVIPALDGLYSTWMMILNASWVYCYVARSETLERRLRYVFAFLLTYFIGGVVLATLLSSAGPCFFGNLVDGANPYAEQLALLDRFPNLTARNYQNVLWADHARPGIGVFGISAMPSIHCATTTLLALMFSKTRLMRILTLAFLAAILLGSFLLAWHYVVDAMLGVVVALSCWHLAGRLARRYANGSQPG